MSWHSFVCAYEVGPFVLHGFLSERYVNTAGNHYLDTDSNKGTFEGTEAGLNIFYRAPKYVYAGAQIFSRNLGEHIEQDFLLEQSFVGLQFVPNYQIQFDLKIGKLKLPFGYYGEIRDTPNAYTPVVLPYGQYEEGQRLAYAGNIAYFANIVWRTQLGELDVGRYYVTKQPSGGVSGNIGQAAADFITTQFALPSQTYQDSDAIAFWGDLWRLYYRTPGGFFAVRYQHYSFGRKTRYEAQNLMWETELKPKSQTIALEFNWENWTLLTEQYQVDWNGGETISFFGVQFWRRDGPPQPILTQYAHLEYQASPKTSVYIRYDRAYANEYDKNGDIAVASGAPAHTTWGKAITIGAGHWLTDNIFCKVSGATFDGSGWSNWYNFNPAEYDRYWNYIAAQVAFVF